LEQASGRSFPIAQGQDPGPRIQTQWTDSPVSSFFKTLIDNEVTVELKNDIQIRGTLKSVDQYLNIKLDDIQVVEEIKYPHLVRSPPLFLLFFLFFFSPR
jgi:small nuclear ribonucleoprotein (snRNP)-like protein